MTRMERRRRRRRILRIKLATTAAVLALTTALGFSSPDRGGSRNGARTNTAAARVAG